MKAIEMWHGDCLELLSQVPSGSVKLAICDFPYGNCTRNHWDVQLPLERLWPHLERLGHAKATFVFFANFKFACQLLNHKPSLFRYDLIFEKPMATGFLNAKRMPLRCHEHILIFGAKDSHYTPVKTVASNRAATRRSTRFTKNYGAQKSSHYKGGSLRYPRSIFRISADSSRHYGDMRSAHATQKPLELMARLINMYSQPGDLILDPTMGSGTTGHACVLTGRKFIGIERHRPYFDVAVQRVNKALAEREGAAQ